MARAPPTDPGTPTAHSIPVSPAATLWRATTGETDSRPGAHRFAVRSRWSRAPARAITTMPGNPASATSRLEPLPITRTATGTSALLSAWCSGGQIMLAVGLDPQRRPPPTR